MLKHEERIPVVLENHHQKIFGVFHRPLHQPMFPVVLICHGLAGHKTGKYRLYVKLAHCLSEQGIGSLRFDFRGSGDSEGLFTETRVDGMLSDALVALRFLQSLPEVDNSRIGLFGRSFGGTIATLAGGEFQQIKSLALWAPMFNAHQWQHRWAMANTQELDEETLQKLMIVDGQLASLPFFEQFFSIDIEPSLEKLQHIPFLHVHGTADQIVDISHAHLYKKQRANAEAESEFIELLDADHDFTKLEDQYHVLKITTDWFKSTLK